MRKVMRVPGPASSLLLLLVFASVVAGSGGAAGLQKAIVPESVLRNFATKTVMPDYPASAKHRGVQGRAVALLQISEEGNVAAVKMLEAPDAEIEKSVSDAIRKWKFNKASSQEGGGVRLEGRLTFYFEIIDGRASVRNPRKFQKPANNG